MNMRWTLPMAALLVAGLAQAAETPPPGMSGRAKAQQRWKAADTDGDGAISRAEAEVSMPGVAQRFKKFDIDRDGRIEPEELHHYRGRKKDRRAASE